ncbi:hypothetical protein [Parafrigoribacterium humi]|jgi:hypothetical protein|uniref:hypothetical protein n=1 Tax=Parafrigoribacterium humi TaxID=3144664 RepID=UPI0032ED0DA8
MTLRRERTRQQLDPAGVTGMRPVTIAAAVAAFVYALAMTLREPDHLRYPVLAALALVLLAVACCILVVQSAPLRAPLTATTHFFIHLFALGSATLSVAASWGANRYVADDWAPVSLGILLLALSLYRPSRELAGAGSLAAIYLGFLVLLEVPTLSIPAPPVALVIAAVTPMLAICFGSAVFGASFVSALERWQSRAELATRRMTTQLRAGIVRSVQQDRVTILNKDVLPFFTEVLSRGEVTIADRERAAMIADSIRGLMVAEADRSWLEQVVEHTGYGRERGHVAGFVHDPHRLAPMITTRQRTAMRALLVALFDEPGFDHQSLRFDFARRGGKCVGVLTAAVDSPDYAVRTALAPYFAVMRVVFSDLHIELSQSRLELRMSYEQQR